MWRKQETYKNVLRPSDQQPCGHFLGRSRPPIQFSKSGGRNSLDIPESATQSWSRQPLT